MAAAGRAAALISPAAARAWRRAGVAQATPRDPAGRRHREAPQPAVLAAHHPAHPRQAVPAVTLPLPNLTAPVRKALPAAAASWARPPATALSFPAFCWLPWACCQPGGGSDRQSRALWSRRQGSRFRKLRPGGPHALLVGRAHSPGRAARRTVSWHAVCGVTFPETSSLPRRCGDVRTQWLVAP
jgi:hypothetical protein